VITVADCILTAGLPSFNVDRLTSRDIWLKETGSVYRRRRGSRVAVSRAPGGPQRAVPAAKLIWYSWNVV